MANQTTSQIAQESGAVPGADRNLPVGKFLEIFDDTVDRMLARFGCTDLSAEVRLISHWQDDSYLISMTRLSDGAHSFKTVWRDGRVLPPFSSDTGASR